MKVLVFGGRNFTDFNIVKWALSPFQSLTTCIITGGARGTDAMAERWAREKGIACAVFPAPWAFYGKGAGPVRNQWMLEFGEPDAAVGFPGGAGTNDMARRVEKAKINFVDLRGGWPAFPGWQPSPPSSAAVQSAHPLPE